MLDNPEHGLELIVIDGIGEYFKITDLESNIHDKREGDTNKSKYINTFMICAKYWRRVYFQYYPQSSRYMWICILVTCIRSIHRNRCVIILYYTIY